MTIDMNSRDRESRTPPWPGQLTIVALSHLRWDFVYQRPQHLLSRAARQHRVLYVEEPQRDASTPFMEMREDRSGVTIAVPHLSASSTVSDLRLLARSTACTGEHPEPGALVLHPDGAVVFGPLASLCRGVRLHG